eukprot:Mycagemm_TRINITY_DN10207_c0_g1::TRINITY_DN10207_c0_g1_i2::g.3789::m.3789 type:complete len:115 gc:universal TRINITY_DN10207_c0_g1_i2:607-951(+)
MLRQCTAESVLKGQQLHQCQHLSFIRLEIPVTLTFQDCLSARSLTYHFCGWLRCQLLLCRLPFKLVFARTPTHPLRQATAELPLPACWCHTATQAMTASKLRWTTPLSPLFRRE